ncbi:MAG: linear amide C-N hydrolase [Pelolinea sp.]|jgi:hypothetical protein|nr:linear amide C-N hydrolase [Pelolinea sp.]
MVKKFILVVTVFIIGFLSDCAGMKDGFNEPLEDAKDLDGSSAVEQISDYPFYWYSYPGDYGFDEYLKTGMMDDRQAVSFSQPHFACSCFASFGNMGQAIFGRNFDWYFHPVMILFTQPSGGYRSVSMVDISYLGYDDQNTPLDDPEALRYVPYLPFDGMNEMGFAAGMMSVAHAEGGDDPEKITIGSLELMRLMLDHAANVESALALIQDYNVDFDDIPIHYLIADREGNSAIIEYIHGEPVVIRNDKNWQVATNFLISETSSSTAPNCWRYNLLEQELQRFQGGLGEGKAMELLEKVSQPGDFATRWSVLYDLEHGTIQVAIGRHYHEVYRFSLN